MPTGLVHKRTAHPQPGTQPRAMTSMGSDHEYLAARQILDCIQGATMMQQSASFSTRLPVTYVPIICTQKVFSLILSTSEFTQIILLYRKKVKHLVGRRRGGGVGNMTAAFVLV